MVAPAQDGAGIGLALPNWSTRAMAKEAKLSQTAVSRDQVERRFVTLTEKQIRRGTHRSTRQLENAIRQSLEQNNAAPKPIVWAKSADDILASVERFCMRISNSGH